MSELTSGDLGLVNITIAWRRTDFFKLKYFTKAPVIYAPHDWFGQAFDLKDLSGITFLTEHQREAYLKGMESLASIPQTITGNGVDMAQFTPALAGQRNQLLCVYCSAYNRGLEGLLDVWPQVRAAHPNALLDIYYGRETFLSGQEDLIESLVRKITTLTDQGVVEKGRVPHAVLAQALMGASLLCAQSQFEETYGIVHAKAIAAGVIPVITNVIDRALVPSEIEFLDKESPTLSQEFSSLIVKRLSQAKTGQLEGLRQKCVEHANDVLGWAASATRLSHFIGEL